MALHIRDEETDRLVRRLAQRRGIPLTEAVKTAVRNELAKDADDQSLWVRVQPILDRVASWPPTGLAADKAFYDSLYDE